MYDGVSTNIDSNVTTVADDVARLCICKAHTISNASHSTGAVRKTDTEVCIYTHNESGAVSTVCKACTAIYIWITNELGCKACNGTAACTSTASADYNRLRRRLLLGALALLGFCCGSCFLCCFTLCFFLGKTSFLFLLGLRIYIICSQIYKICGYPTITFFDGYLYETILFIQNCQLLTHGNETQDRRICGSFLANS